MNQQHFIPFARPTIDEEMVSAVADVLRSRWLASGPKVQAFEVALSNMHGGRPVRCLTSATAGLEVALQVCGIGPGDEVITSAMSFFAAANMIMRVGAKPVFVDCELDSRNIDIEQVEMSITPATRAILPTHFGGMPCDLEKIYALAHKHHLRVIEDAALAIGSRWQGDFIGTHGDITVFSFHPNKNLTTIEGGAVVFADEPDARRAELLRFHGIVRLPDGTRDVGYPGGKFNMSDVSAALGLAQLAKLEAWNERRRALAQHYFDCFTTFPTTPALALHLPARMPAGQEAWHSWNMFCVLLPLSQLRIGRKEFIDLLAARGIGIGISYEALHLTTLCRPLGYQEGVFPNSERISRETVTLPLYPEMSEADVERVVEEVSDVLMQNAA
jgi:dTDP-4-amino-4,6-dideoxygalactose transaminase